MSMEIDDEEIEVTTSTSSKGEKKRFEVKKVRKYHKEMSPLYFSLPIVPIFIC